MMLATTMQQFVVDRTTDDKQIKYADIRQQGSISNLLCLVFLVVGVRRELVGCRVVENQCCVLQ